MEFIMVTGLSGAGKTLVLRNLEDMGYFCVDNLPPGLLPNFMRMFAKDAPRSEDEQLNKVAVVIDSRASEFFDDLGGALKKIGSMGIDFKILYLEANDETIIKRFKETRRRHPLEKNRSLLQAIEEERKKLQTFRDKATYILDTSPYSPKQLREMLYVMFSPANANRVLVSVVSFGFKHGIPLDADIVLDVRFLPNPYYIPELRYKSGLDPEVRDYLFGFEQTVQFLDKLEDMVLFLLPYYLREAKNKIIVAVGCTGGMHRSVAIAEELYRRITAKGERAYIEHRNINRDNRD